jgi:hypothetical protein
MGFIICINQDVAIHKILTICRAPSFCLGSAFGDVKTCIMKCIVFCNISFLFLHEEWSNVCAAVTGDTKSSNMSVTVNIELATANVVLLTVKKIP